MAVSKRTRFEVLRRDNHTCRYCGGVAPDVTLTVDHVVPVALGGNDGPSNLVAACRDCNYGKASTSPDGALVEDVKALDLTWGRAMARAAEIQAQKRAERDAYIVAFADLWESLGRKLPSDGSGLIRLFDAGLPLADMLDAAELAAMNRGVYERFPYFMGVAWKKLTALQEAAKEILAAEEAE